MASNDIALSTAYYACLVDQEHVIETFSRARSILELKTQLLNSPLEFTLRDELDLHRAVMAFATACISHISTLQKRAGLEKLTFPIYHDFLRLFRDFNHHEHYISFTPYRASIAGEDQGKDFYVFTTANQIPAIKAKYPEWLRKVRKLNLESLLILNYKYLASLSEEAQRKKFGQINIKVNVTQRCGLLHIPEVDRVHWENELNT
ncbi:hypothetical protein IMCC1989_2587 [gamma proteobacterium IMCC1989]|nr:hypothetical protein IMCC1989_2587 [gamma proteobacterium IMCC1989]